MIGSEHEKAGDAARVVELLDELFVLRFKDGWNIGQIAIKYSVEQWVVTEAIREALRKR